MANNTYLDLVDGKPTQKAAINTSAGAGDAGKVPALDAGGKINDTMMPDGVGADTSVFNASEDLAAGDFVDLWDDSGTVKVRKADGSTTGKVARGFVNAAVTTGNPATVYHSGVNSNLTGLSKGDEYFLSATAGQVTDTALSTSGQTSQSLGFARSATELVVKLGEDYVIATS